MEGVSSVLFDAVIDVYFFGWLVNAVIDAIAVVVMFAKDTGWETTVDVAVDADTDGAVVYANGADVEANGAIVDVEHLFSIVSTRTSSSSSSLFHSHFILISSSIVGCWNLLYVIGSSLEE